MTVKLHIDASVLSGPMSGVGVYLHELLARLPDDFTTTLRGASVTSAGRAGGKRQAVKALVRRLPLAYRARQLALGWPPSPRDAVYFAPNFIAPPWPLVRGRLVVTVHDLIFLSHPGWADGQRGAFLRAQLGDSLRRASDIVVTTQANGRLVCASFGPALEAKLRVIPLGVRDLSVTTEAPRSDIVCLGNVEPRKGVLELVHAHQQLPAALKQRHPLLLVGNALDADYAAQVRATLDASQRWLENTDDAEVRQHLGRARLFVAPSFAEGFGLTPLEAYVAGAPVLARDLPVFHELLGERARYFSADHFTERLRDALEAAKPPSLEERRALADTYSWARCAQAHVEIFRRR